MAKRRMGEGEKEVSNPTHATVPRSRKIVDTKIHGLNTHDYHNLQLRVLPMAIRGILHEGIRNTIYKVGKIFKWIGQTHIVVLELQAMKRKGKKALCDMEMSSIGI